MNALFRKTAVLFLFLTSFSGFATVLPFTSGIVKTPVSGSPQVERNTLTATAFTTITPTSGNTNFVDLSRKGMLSFGVDHHYPTPFTAYTAEITVVVKRYPTAGGSALADTTVIMDVTYQPNNPDSLTFQDKHTVTFGNVEAFKFVIKEIKINGSNVDILPANLYLQGDVFVDRIYEFETKTTTVTPSQLGLTIQNLEDLDCDGYREKLTVSWNAIEDAEEYQLEWVYVNDYGFTTTAPNVDFRNNSTRITTTKTSYDLSMIFDKGYICFRVRAVGRSHVAPYRFLFTAWSTNDGSLAANTVTPNYHITTPFDPSKNWQYSATFAEEGKKKEVISFFDGSLRNRQMVTKINSDKNTIVGETIYDHLGRPVVQVLPSPVTTLMCSNQGAETALRYYENFNQNSIGNPYAANDFEQLNPPSECNPMAANEMGTGDGASRYYSSQNPNLVGNPGYVPNAEGFPFSQVEYAPDNTGRVYRQGGVGRDFQLGSDHETKYFYAHPFQEQLDRLFGSEVGDATHYQKNMVIDPNGQVSISYLDQEGRVIATSLAGKVPDNLQPLPSAAEAGPLNVDLLAKDATGNSASNVTSPDGKSKVFNQTIALSSKSDVTIHYDMNIAPFENTCLPENVCFNCIYDLKIQVRNLCGSLVSPEYISNKKIGQFTTGTNNELIFQTTCNAYTEDDTFIIEGLEPGTYQISKILTVNEEAIEEYIDMYVTDSLDLNTCFTTYNEYLNQVAAASNIDNCNQDFSCAQCVADLGPLLAFLEAGGTEAEYQQALDECNAPCKPISYYETMRLVLLADVMPGGQYGEYLNNQGNEQVGNFPLSVLNPSNTLPKASATPANQAFWKYPKYDIEASIQNFYFEEDGVTKSRIPLTGVVINNLNQVTSSNPAVDGFAPINTKVFLDPQTNEYYTYPQYLADVEDFIEYYLVNSSWANSLVIYHPEYPILSIFKSFTEKNNPADQYSSESFDQEMMTINTFQDAVTNGFIDGSTNMVNAFNIASSTLPWDPYSVYNSAALQSKITNYTQINGVWFSMMEVAAMITRCPNELVGYMPSASCTQFGTNIGTDPVHNTEIRDAEWMAFRGLYYSAKQALQLEYAKTQSLTNPSYYGYNECIGNDNFNPFENGFITIASGLPFTVNGGFWNTIQPCNIWNHLKYINKQKRFGNPVDYVDTDPQQAAYQIYLQTGQCPVGSSFQLLLNQVAQQHLLESDPINMNTLTATSAVLMSAQNYEVSGPLPALTWHQITNSTGVLEVLWEETATSAPYATFRLVQNTSITPTFAWNEIIAFNNLQFTTVSSGLYSFTVDVKVNQGGTIFTRQLTGNTTLKIGNCSFPDQCLLNDQGKAVEKMMKLLASGSQLTSTSYVTVSSAPYNFLYTQQFQYTVSPTTTGVAKFRYVPSLPGFEFLDGTTTLTLGINAVEPTTFSMSSMNLIASISEMIPGPNNTFKLVCLDASGNHLVTLSCDAIRATGSGFTGIPMGTCGLADPILCQGTEYKTFNDLEALFKDVLVNQNAPFDLVFSQQWSNNLIGQLPSSPATLHSVESTSGGRKRLTFTMPGSCNLVLSSKNTSVNFNNITAVSAMHLLPATNSGGANYDFYLKVTYTNGSTTVNDTLFGTSCFKLNECSDCEKGEARDYTPQELETITNNLMISGVLEEDNTIISYVDYKSVVDGTNQRLNWNEGDPYYLRAISYQDYFNKGLAYSIGGYIQFATGYVEGMDGYYLLENPFNYVDKYGSGKNLTASYERYTEAVNKYNDNRTANNLLTIATVGLFTFAQTIYSDDCSDYVNYLKTEMNQTASVLPVDNYPNAQDAKIDEGQCKALYVKYLNAYQVFEQQQQSNETCLNYHITMPLVPYQAFIDNNLCCSSYGIQLVQNYTNSFADSTACPGPLPVVDDCTSPEEVDAGKCRENWSLYLKYIDTYNHSDWAIANHSELAVLYPTFKTFMQMGYCDCVSDYNNYLQTYIKQSTETEPETPLPLPQTIDQFCGQTELDYGNTPCQNEYEEYLHCVALYNDKAVEGGKEYVVTLVKMEAFYQNDLCFCVDQYCSELNMVLDGLKHFERMPDLYTFCKDNREEPCVRAGDTIAYETFEMEFDDPCTEFYQSNNEVNALIAYNEQVQNFQTTLAEQYIKHCMAAMENMTLEYNEIEHHFTLYYYDQAGNLIRTIPPEGVEMLDISDASLKTRIKQDRQNNTHQVITNHRMATTYLYNSLNQLVAQNMPDQDAMKIFEAVAPNGLPTGLNTTAIQMVDANIGYLTGYIEYPSLPFHNRGYLYKTTNGGSNWIRMSHVLGANFKEIAMVDASTGYAVANDGMLLMTSDGGFNWDLMDTYSAGVFEDFAGLDVAAPKAFALSKSGRILELSGSSVATVYDLTLPSGLTVNEVKDFTLQGVSPVSGTTLLIANITNNGLTYDAVLRRVGATTTIENSQVADLKTIGFYSNDNGLAAGVDGNLSALSGTGPANFTQKLGQSGTAGTIDQLFMLTSQIGLARIEENGTKVIRKTTNGGISWDALQNDYANASLALIKQGTSSKEILVQGYNTLTSQSYTKSVILFSNGNVSEVDQTPNIPQGIEIKNVTAYVDGTNVTYFGIGADQKLYRTNTFTSGADNVVYTPVSGVALSGTLSAKKILALKDGSGISIEVLASDGNVYRSASTSLTGGYSGFTAVSGASSIAAIDKLSTSGGEYTLAYAGNTLYGKAAANTTFVAFSTTISPGTSVIENLVVHGTKVSLVGTNGGLFTSTSGIVTVGAPITFTDRKNHAYTDLTSIRTNGNDVIITGKNGLVASRAKSTAAATSYVRPVGTTEDIYESGYRVNGSNTFIGLVGSNGYFTEQQVVSGSWTQQPAFYTASGVPVSTFANGKDLRSVAYDGQSVLLAGEQGMVFYSANINTAFLTTVNPLTAHTLNSAVFIPGYAGAKALVAGNQNELILYNAHLGTRITGIYPSKLKDVHFENNQYGTVVGDNYFGRTTATGATSWSVIAPEPLSLVSSNAFSVRKIVTKIAADGTPNFLIGVDNAIRLMQGNTLVDAAIFGSSMLSDIQFNKTSPLLGYVAADQELWSIELTPSSLSASTFGISYSQVYNAPQNIRAIHIFENHSVAMAGENGMIAYRKFSDGSSFLLASVSGVNFNEIYFKDNKNGFVVGDAGAFYYLTSGDNDPVTHELNGTVAYDPELTLDPILNNNTGYTIRALAFSTLNKAVYGGEYTNPSDITSKKAFVRSLKQENNLYTARFFYDRLGRIVVSQNSRQLADNKYSYTLYDALGRVYEAGEKHENTYAAPFASIFGTYVGGSFVPSVIDDAKLKDWLDKESTETRKEVTKSYYDVTNPAIAALGLPITLDETTQRKRIVHVTYEAVYDAKDETYDHATHYDYDIHGNVKTVLQDNRLLKDITNIAQHRFKRVDYVYDLISGNVHRVDYETGKADQWHHAYNYDADNRITDVYTSTETPVTTVNSSIASLQNEPEINALWYKEADYSYYAHGPLARTVLSDEEVQGLDYVYTLQGWIKSVNSNTLDVNRDPGEDGKGLSPNHNVARDVFGYSLHYFEHDYAGAIGGNNSFVAQQASSDLTDNSFDLYNGNIARMVTTITDPNDRTVLPLGNAYRYDQLNRLKEARSYNFLDKESNSWMNGGTQMYYNAFQYDANGNITHQLRRDENDADIDDMTYFYEGMNGVLDSQSANPSMKVKRNRLYFVRDKVDYDDNDINPGMSVSNYAYDGEGRLIKDEQEEIAQIIWRVDGKVKKIVRSSGSAKKNVSFDYDAMGHRIAKHLYNSEDTWLKSTYYVLDAQGNTMATYEHVLDVEKQTITFAQTEKHLYGSSRLGMHTEKVPMYGSQNSTYSMRSVTHHIGERTYELSNHLGNVLSVISDKVIPQEDAGGGTVTLFNDEFTASGNLLGWEPDDDAIVSSDALGAGFTLTASGGTLNMNCGTDANLNGKMYKAYTFTAGVNYTLTFDYTSTTNSYALVGVFSSSSSMAIAPVNFGSNTVTFTGDGQSGYVGFIVQAQGLATFDNINLTYSSSAAQVYLADIRHAQDYSPFGVTLHKRDLSLTSGSGNVPYRYGFNGMEKDDELKGEGNSYDFGARMYDSRLGRFLSIDPKSSAFPFISSYCYAANSPIVFIDENGEGPIIGWHVKSMSRNDETKTYTIEYDLTVSRDFLLVNMSSLNLTNAEGLQIAQDIASKWAASDFTFLIDSKTAVTEMLDFLIRKQYGHIPKDYKLEFKVNVDFIAGNVAYQATQDPSNINSSELLIGIVDQISHGSGEVGLSLSKDAILVQKEYISPSNRTLSSGEELKASNVPSHELGHEDGAGDTYDGPYNGCGIMGKAGNVFNLCEATRRQLAVQLLIRARAGHDILMGERSVAGYTSPINPEWYQKMVNSKKIPFGKISIDPDLKGTNGEKLKDMKVEFGG
ncbi:RHS repeat-associated core domain-containing protein [Fluviicola sp.]|uniref:DUF6443 domain-containing protein n=1 Tax=Fluviicola sp. TaxID=1917219 RepID=UPI0031D9BC97